jgi:hypothetical protein
MNLICFVFLLSRLEKNYHPKLLAGILLASAIAGMLLFIKATFCQFCATSPPPSAQAPQALSLASLGLI